MRITEDMIVPFDKRPQEYMGVEVVAREPGMSPHPHPSQNGRLVETIGVTRVLLANGHEFFECGIRQGDGVCPKQSRSSKSIVSHLTFHNPNKNNPLYDLATLRVVLRVAAEERQRNFRGYGMRAAERLNEDYKTVRRLDGKPWVSSDVTRLWSQYHERYGPQRVHVRRPVTPQPTPQPPKVTPATVNIPKSRPGAHGELTPPASARRLPAATRPTAGTIRPTPTEHVDVEVRVTRVLGLIDHHMGKIVDLRNEVVALLAQVKQLPDPASPEITRKAELYDTLMAHARATERPS